MIERTLFTIKSNQSITFKAFLFDWINPDILKWLEVEIAVNKTVFIVISFYTFSRSGSYRM